MQKLILIAIVFCAAACSNSQPITDPFTNVPWVEGWENLTVDADVDLSNSDRILVSTDITNISNVATNLNYSGCPVLIRIYGNIERTQLLWDQANNVGCNAVHMEKVLQPDEKLSLTASVALDDMDRLKSTTDKYYLSVVVRIDEERTRIDIAKEDL